jgi:hypothetical protein
VSEFGGRATEDALARVFAGHIYTSRINSDPSFEGLPEPGEHWADFAERVGRHLAVVLCEALDEPADEDEDAEEDEDLGVPRTRRIPPEMDPLGAVDEDDYLRRLIALGLVINDDPEARDSDTRVISGSSDVEDQGGGGTFKS